MNIKAKLFFLKQERILLHTDVNYERYIAWNGKPTTDLLDGTIRLSFESQMYDDLFVESMLEHRFGNSSSVDRYYQKLYKPHNGKIVFYEDDDYEIELFQYNFKDAVITELHEDFNNQHGMYMNMVISPALQNYRFFEGNSTWDKKEPTSYLKLAWMESWVPPRGGGGVKTNKPSLINIFYSDSEGTVIPKNELSRGETVYLTINTQNAVGKYLSIDLDNNKLDYEYKGIPLEDDVLDVKVSADEMKVELKTIAQR